MGFKGFWKHWGRKSVSKSSSSNEELIQTTSETGAASTPPLFENLGFYSVLLINQVITESRRRVNSKLEDNPISTTQLVLAIREHMTEEDNRRLENLSDYSPPTKIPTDKEVNISHLLHFLHMSFTAYEANEGKKKELISMLDYRLLFSRHKAEKFKPSYLVAYSFSRDVLQVTIRGTYDIADVVTDLSVETEAFQGMEAHKGIICSARNLLEEIEQKLLEFVEAYDPNDIVFTGHSLGASTASVMAILLREKYTKGKLSMVRTVGFCPAPFMTDEKMAASYDYIQVMVHNSDIIPRLSLASLERFQYKVSLIVNERRNQKNKKKDENGSVSEDLEETEPDLNEITEKGGEEGKKNEEVEEDETKDKVEESERSEEEKEKGVHEKEFYIPGKIWHIWRDPSEDGSGETRIEERKASDYLEIMASKSMIDDHQSTAMFDILDGLIEKQYFDKKRKWTRRRS